MPPRTRIRLADQATAIGPTTTPIHPPAGSGLVAALTTAATPHPDTAEVPIGLVAPSPNNVRADLGDLTELADSIRAEGIIQPLVVVDAELWRHHHPHQTVTGQYVVVAGHRRRAAAELAGLDRVPIVIRDRFAAPERATVAMLIENVHRADLTPLEQARGLADLAATGLSQREIARQTGLSQAQVSKRLSLLRLTTRGQQALAAGDMSVDTALALLKLPTGRQDHALDRAAKLGKSISNAVYDIEQRIEKERLRQTVIEQLTAQGVTVVPEFDTAADGRTGRYYDYALSYRADRDAAIAAGLAIAVVPEWCTHPDHADYFTPTPQPWPWQHKEKPADADGEDLDSTGDVDSDSTGIATPAPIPPTAEQVATQSRQRAITAYLTQAELPAGAAELLATLTVLVAAGDGGPDLDLAASLLGRDPWPWNETGDILTTVAADGTADQRLRHALALIWSVLEGDYPPADNDIADLTYQALIAGLITGPTSGES